MKRKTFFLAILLAFSLSFAAASEDDDQIGLGLIIKSLNMPEIQSLSVKKGAFVVSVLPGSPAEKAGFKEKDVVVKANGKAIDEAKQLNDLVEELKEGDKLTATVIREGEKVNLKAEIEFKEYDSDVFSYTMSYPPMMGRIGHQPMYPPMPGTGPMMKGGWLGCNLDFINDQLKEYFEVEAGALVKSVVEDSPAEKAGIKAGDVIVKIDVKKIEDPADVMRTVNYHDPDDKVAVKVVRKGKKKTLWVKLGKKPFGPQGRKTYWISGDSDGPEEDMDINVNVTSSGKTVKVMKMRGRPGMSAGPMPGMSPGGNMEIKLQLFVI